ncbi:MAG TPA: AAA family ATPase [Thermomicrobiales bacterium]|nr:AAA family ATPase [Thermomicrobiales bacterium]
MYSPEEHTSHAGSASIGTRRPPLVGRSRELLVLRAQLAEALAGSGSIVVLGGEAGVGKSRLADTLCREASEAGALAIAAHCYDLTVTPPYGPWGELVERYASLRKGSSEPPAIPAPQLLHGTSQAQFFGEMRDFIFAIARSQPLVILLEDVQWADVESLDLLRVLARQLAQVPVLMVVTYRNNEVTRVHPLHRLVPILVREALAVRIDVSPLTDDSVRALVEATYRLPDESTVRLTTHLQQRAEGNPFFVIEFLRSLEGSVLLRTADGAWMLGALEAARIPLLLRQVIDQRLSRIGPEAEALLAIGAIIGQSVPLALWSAVSGTTQAALIELVERAIETNIMGATADGTAARFTHALIRDSLYEGVLPPKRRAWHLQIAEALLRLEAAVDPDEVAFHLYQAGDRRAADWLTRAGERAQLAFAWRTAVQRFESALTLLEHDPAASGERGWLRLRLALLRRFEDPAAGVGLLVEAERLGRDAEDRALIAYARFFQGMLRCMQDDFQLGIEAEEAGIAMLDALTPHDRARLLAVQTTSDQLDPQNGRGEFTLALAGNGRLEQARTLGEHLIGLPADQTTGSLGDAWYGLGFTYAALGRPEAARQAFQNARAVFAAEGHRSMVTASLFDELMVVLLPYRIDRTTERTRMEFELAESFEILDGITDQQSKRAARVVSAVIAGEWAEAIDMLEQCSLRFMRRHIPALLAPIARVQGDYERAWLLLSQLFPVGPDTSPKNLSIESVALRPLAVALALDAGDHELARRWLESFDAWLIWSGSIAGQAEAHLWWAAYLRAVGDREAARIRAEQALAAASAPRQPLVLLATRRFLGELDLADERLIQAEEQFAAAMSLVDSIGSAHERSLTMLARADLLRVRGEFRAARALLDAVRAISVPMNAALTLSMVDALEARLPAESSPVEKPPAGLTPREVDVLRLLAMGLPNGEIALRLSLSSRTIDTHLTNIYGKLGVSTRGAAIRFALEHDLSQSS